MSAYRPTRLLSRLLCCSALVLPAAAVAQMLPTGGHVAAGAAHIGTPSNGNLTVTQSSQRAVVNWQSFNVGSGQTVTFAQPNTSAATLNRVGGASGSTVAGQINATGKVYLVNPNGIQITPTGDVDAKGGFIASTLGMSNRDFMKGTDSFSGNSTGTGVVNQGSITTGSGGTVALIGNSAANEGTITAPLGHVALGAGNAATLDVNGDGFLQVTLPTNATDASGKPLVSNSGTISAQGGDVEMKAAAVSSAMRDVVNMSGSIDAQSVSGHDGDVVLGGGQGTTRVTGQVDVSGADHGGRIDVTGANVVLEGATLNASGSNQGGLVRIGGAFQGGKPEDPSSPQTQAYVGRFGNVPALAPADTTTIDSGSRIDVGSANGAGGTAIVWSNSETVEQGRIDARGTTSGGAVEVSSKSTIQSIDLTAIETGAGGRLLLDPMDIVIEDDPGDGSVTFDPIADYAFADNTGNQTTLNSQDVIGVLQSGTALTLQASHDITWNTGIADWHTTDGSTPGTLTLDAGHSVSLSGAFFTGNGSITLIANDTEADGVVESDRGDPTAPAEIDVSQALLTMGGGNLSLEMRDGAYSDGMGGTLFTAADRIDPNGIASVNNLTIAIAATAPGTPSIVLDSHINAGGAVSLTGNLFIASEGSSVATLSGTSVTWTDASSAETGGRGQFEFVANGTPVAIGDQLPGHEMVHLDLGSTQTLSKTYGDADPTIGDVTQLQADQAWLTAHGFSLGDFTLDDFNSILVAGSLSLAGPGTTAPAGSNVLTISPMAANVAIDRNVITNSYFIDLTPANYALTINPKTLTPTVNAGAYTYGAPNPVADLSGIINGDSVVPVATVTGVGPNQVMVADGGDYAFDAHLAAANTMFTLTGLGGPDAGNYTLDLSGTISASLAIAQKALTYNACCNLTATYGTLATPALSFSGVLAGDDVSASGISVNGGAVTLAAKTAAGSYTLTATGLMGAEAGDYTLPVGNGPTLTINPLTVTYTAPSGTVTYGNTFAGTVTLNGVLAGDDVSAPLDVSAGGPGVAYSNHTDAGSYQTEAGTLGGTAAGNYVIAGAGNTNGSLTIAPLTLAFTLSDETSQYGATTTPSVNLSGVLFNDDVSAVVATNAPGGLSSTTNAGTYTANVTGLTGGKAGDYVLGTGNANATITIDPKTITFTGIGSTSTYGDPTAPSSNVTLNGLVNLNDSTAIHPVLTITDGSGNAVTPANTDTSGLGQTVDTLAGGTHAGTYTVSVALASSDPNHPASNYTLSTTTAQSITVDPKTLRVSITLAPSQWTYGSAVDIAPDATFTGFIAGDGGVPIMALTDSHGTVVGTANPANQQFVHVPGGVDAGIYTLSVVSFQPQGNAEVTDYTLVPQNTVSETIQPKALTWTANNTSATYGTVASLSAVLAGVFGSDDVSVTGFSLTDSNNNPAALTAQLTGGTYTIGAAALGGAKAFDYTLASNGNATGTLTVSPKTITWSISNTSDVYGSANALNDMGTVSFSGVLQGDTLGATTDFFAAGDTPASHHPPVTINQSTPAGPYNMFVTGLTGSQAMLADYRIDPNAANTPGILTVAPEPITVGLAPVTLTYGTPFTGTTFGVTSGTLFNGDQLVFDGYQVNLGAGNVGSYALNATLHVNANYAVTVTPSTVEIDPLALKYSVGDLTWIYGDLTDAQVAAISPVVTFEKDSDSSPYSPVSSVGLAVSALGSPITLTQTSNVGSYDVAPALSSANYTLVAADSHDGTLTITPRTLTLVDTTSVYGDRPSLALRNALPQDGITVADAVLTDSTGAYQIGSIWNPDGSFRGQPASPPPVDTYSVSAAMLGGTRAFNYVLGSPAGVQLAITPRPITIASMSPVTATYGDNESQDYVLGNLVFPGSVDVGNPPVFTGTVTYTNLVNRSDAASFEPAMALLQTSQGVGTYVWQTATNATRELWAIGSTNPQGVPTNVNCTQVGCMNLNYMLVGSGSATVTINPKVINAYTISNISGTYGTPLEETVVVTGILRADAKADSVAPQLGLFAPADLSSTSNGLPTPKATLVVGDDPSGFDATTDTTTYTTSAGFQAGQYDLLMTGLVGSAAANYVFAGNPENFGTANIAPKPITYTTAGGTAYYGIGGINGSLDDLGQYALSGVLSGDSVGAIVQIATSSGALLPVNQAINLQQGDYTLVVTNLTGPQAGDYVIANTGNAPGAMSSIDLINLNGLSFLGNDEAGNTIFQLADTARQQANAAGADISSTASIDLTSVTNVIEGVPQTASSSTTSTAPTSEADAVTQAAIIAADAIVNAVDTSTGTNANRQTSNDISTTDETSVGSPGSCAAGDVGCTISQTYGRNDSGGVTVGGCADGTVCFTGGASYAADNEVQPTSVQANDSVTSSANVGTTENSNAGQFTQSAEVDAKLGASANDGVLWEGDSAKIVAGAKLNAGLVVEASNGVSGSYGSIDSTVGTTVGGLGADASLGGGYSNGSITFEISGEIDVGPGLEFDISGSLNVGKIGGELNDAFNGTNTSYVAFNDPDAAQQRESVGLAFVAEAQALQQKEQTFVSNVLAGDYNGGASDSIAYMAQNFKAREALIESDAAAQGFTLAPGQGGTFLLTDNNPPPTHTVTEHSPGIDDAISGEASSIGNSISTALHF